MTKEKEFAEDLAKSFDKGQKKKVMAGAPEEVIENVTREKEKQKRKVEEIEERIEDLKGEVNTSEIEGDLEELKSLMEEVEDSLERGDYDTAEEKLEEVNDLYSSMEEEVEGLEEEAGGGILWWISGIVLAVIIVLIYYLLTGSKEGHKNGSYTYKSPQEESLAEKIKSATGLGGSLGSYTYKEDIGLWEKIKRKFKSGEKQKKYTEY